MLDFNYLQLNRNGKRKQRTKQEIKLKIKMFFNKSLVIVLVWFGFFLRVLGLGLPFGFKTFVSFSFLFFLSFSYIFYRQIGFDVAFFLVSFCSVGTG